MDYTPTTEEVRQWTAFGDLKGGLSRANPFEREDAFTRWIEAHDAEIRADQIEKDADAVERALTTDNRDEWSKGVEWARFHGATAIRAQLTPRPHYELFPGTQEALDALTIRKEGS